LGHKLAPAGLPGEVEFPVEYSEFFLMLEIVWIKLRKIDRCAIASLQAIGALIVGDQRVELPNQGKGRHSCIFAGRLFRQILAEVHNIDELVLPKTLGLPAR